MTEALPRVLGEADHQARVLGNLVRALQIIGGAYDEVDAENRFHLRRLTCWVGRQLRPQHDPATIVKRVDLPVELKAELVELLSDQSAEPKTAAGVETVLVDADHSGEGFLARLSVTDAPINRASETTFGATFEAALDRARQQVFRLFTRGGRLRPGRELLRASWFTLDGPRAATMFRAEGGSIAAAAALALYAHWSGEALPDGVVVTGCLGDEGELLPVAGMEAKVAAVLRERPGVTRFVVPSGQGIEQDPRIVEAASLEQLLAETLGTDLPGTTPAGVVDVEGTVRLGFELYEKEGSFALAHDLLQTALGAIDEQRKQRGDPGLWRVEEFLSLWRTGSCLIHQGEPEGARPLFQRAAELGEALWQEGSLDPKAYFGCRGNQAVLLRDLFEYQAAERLLKGNLDQQRALRQDRRELAKTLGNLGELLTITERYQEAEEALLEALESLRSTYPDELPRELCYLGNLELRRGDLLAARGRYEEGLLQNRLVTYGERRNEAFLRYGLVRAHVALGEGQQAVRHAERALSFLPRSELYPRQLILKYRGLAWLQLGRTEQGEADLLAAGDLTHARGCLAEIAAATALGELALVQLHTDRWDRAVALGRQILALGGELMKRMDPPSTELLKSPLDPKQLKVQLRRWLDHFPY